MATAGPAVLVPTPVAPVATAGNGGDVITPHLGDDGLNGGAGDTPGTGSTGGAEGAGGAAGAGPDAGGTGQDGTPGVVIP